MFQAFIDHIIKRKTIYIRVMWMLALVLGFIILAQCVECEYNSRDGISIKWVPAADITINKNL